MLATAILAGGAGWWWAKQPRTPEELYRVRCSSCHKLADLSGYGRADMAAIVRTMRERNGAAGVIDEEEAMTIIRYLEGTKP